MRSAGRGLMRRLVLIATNTFEGGVSEAEEGA